MAFIRSHYEIRTPSLNEWRIRLPSKTLRWMRRYCFAVSVSLLMGLGSTAVWAERPVDFRLSVLNFDTALQSFLLSGEFINSLSNGLLAFRGNLRLRNEHTNEEIFFSVEHRLRRMAPVGTPIVWSVWVDYDAKTSEHVLLKGWAQSDVTASLHLTRALYRDGQQEAFE